MKILGIDPGLRRTGFGLIDAQGQQVRYLASGVITPSLQGNEPERLGELFASVNQLVQELNPDCAVIERVFVNINPKSTLSLGQARGVTIAALAQAKLPISEITPLRIKQSVVGSGRATKEQVQKMVQRHLQLAKTPGADASDALACALAWWQTLAHSKAIAVASNRRKTTG